MNELQRFDTGKRLSEMTLHNGVCYLAGQVAGDASQGMAGQARQVLAGIDALLARAGSSKSRLLSCQIFINDLAEFAQFNEVWEAWLPAGCAPARATVKAQLARPEWKVEVVAIAATAATTASAANTAT